MKIKTIITIFILLSVFSISQGENVKDINLDKQQNELSGANFIIDEQVSLKLTEENWDKWSKSWRSGEQTYLVVIGADYCKETQIIKPIWNELGDYLQETKSDIKLAHFTNFYDHIMGKKEMDIIATPTIYLMKNQKCYFYSWALEYSLESFKWFIDDNTLYPPHPCPYYESVGFTFIRLLQDSFIVPYNKYCFDENFKLQMHITFGVLLFGFVYSFIFKRKP